MGSIRSYLEVDAPLILAHRGASGVMPENTIPACARALELGAEALELDVRVTRDDELVVYHDETVERVTEGEGPVRSFTLAELQRLDAGFRFSPDGGATFPFRGKGMKVPALSEVLQAFSRVRVNVDMKDPDPRGAELLSSLIRRFAAEERVLCASFHTPVLRRFREREPAVATSASRSEVVRFLAATLLGAGRLVQPHFQALQVPLRHSGISVVAGTVLRNAHRLGLSVHVWTINHPSTMRRLLEMGVDGIVTDFPDRLLAVRTQWMNERAPEAITGKPRE